MIKLGEVCVINKGEILTKSMATSKGNIPIIAGGSKPNGTHNIANYTQPCITVSASGTAGYVWYHNYPIFATDCSVIIPKANINIAYIYYVLKNRQEEIYSLKSGGKGVQHVYAKDLVNFQIPLPPLHIQQQLLDKINRCKSKIDEIKNRLDIIVNQIKSINVYATSYIRLNNPCFRLIIGKRIIKNNEYKNFVKNSIPVYSSNVYIPFCYTNKTLLVDFTQPCIVWGIDGNWQVTYFEANKPFYPTDHLGVLYCSDNSINKRYLAYALEKVGRQIGFSRSLRASLDRLEQLQIPLPSIEKQNKIGNLLEQEDKLKLELKKMALKIKIKQEKIMSTLYQS